MNEMHETGHNSYCVIGEDGTNGCPDGSICVRLDGNDLIEPTTGTCTALPTLPKASFDNNDGKQTEALPQHDAEADQSSVLRMPELPVPRRCGGLDHHFQSCPSGYACVQAPKAKPEDEEVPTLANGVCVPVYTDVR